MSPEQVAALALPELLALAKLVLDELGGRVTAQQAIAAAAVEAGEAAADALHSAKFGGKP